MLEVCYGVDGLYLPDLDLWLDPQTPKARAVISHAHSDHIGEHGAIIATPATARLTQHRRGPMPATMLDYGETLEHERFRLTFYPAGHCLGSALTLIEDKASGERLIYTGDFKLRPNPTAASAVIVPCDTLISEATFGHPRYVFPPDSASEAELQRQIDAALAQGSVPVVLAYALGKSQEALALLLRGGYRLSVHGAIRSIIAIYEEFGVSFANQHGSYEPYDRRHLAGRVLLAPPNIRKQPMLTNIASRRVIYLSGWGLDANARWRFGVDSVLPLSDHADWPDLLRMVAESGARRVFTLHGFPDLALHLQAQGLDAQHLLDHQLPLL
jgi:Cft2 family RNA processing exonuclease